MKIAVPVNSDNNVDAHFGHCETYSVFTIDDKKEISEKKKVNSPQGCGCKSDISSLLAADGVTILLAGGIGGGATNAFKKSGIDVIRGCSGNAAELVKLFLNGLVEDSGNCCNHHKGNHGHEHNPEHGPGHTPVAITKDREKAG